MHTHICKHTHTHTQHCYADERTYTCVHLKVTTTTTCTVASGKLYAYNFLGWTKTKCFVGLSVVYFSPIPPDLPLESYTTPPHPFFFSRSLSSTDCDVEVDRGCDCDCFMLHSPTFKCARSSLSSLFTLFTSLFLFLLLPASSDVRFLNSKWSHEQQFV